MIFFITCIFPFILLVVGFFLLIRGASLFVDFSSTIAKKLGVSQLFIALTIVAMGTSIPETAVSLSAALNGNIELSIGNIVGTNSLNILLILGLTAAIAPMSVRKTTVRFEMPIMIMTALIFPLLGIGCSIFTKTPSNSGMFSRADGIVFLALFTLYLLYLVWLEKHTRNETTLPDGIKNRRLANLMLFLLAGLILIITGSSMIVKGATKIAANYGVPERIIGLTVIAFGTSLPELSTSIVASIKKQDDLAVGNIVGSNIYNMLFIGGLTALICPVPYSAKFQFDSLVCIAASVLLLFLVAFNKRRLTRFSGIFMLLCYDIYFMFLLKESFITS